MMLLCAWPLAAEPVPESVRLYQEHRANLPTMEADGRLYGGLSLCKLLTHRDQPQPFFALPADMRPHAAPEEPCDLTRVLVAYRGFCTAGLEDPTGPHWTQPVLPSVEIVDYDDDWTVIYLNHYLQAHVKRTPEGEAAAAAFLAVVPGRRPYIRGAGLPLFPLEYLRQLPPRKEGE